MSSVGLTAVALSALVMCWFDSLILLIILFGEFGAEKVGSTCSVSDMLSSIGQQLWKVSLVS